ncbi:hypothetical protein Fot_35399 [Forsythia ovata]|uniref:Uncharacterized protein n=1 Tax=Forsythia ovata TaxID=205694 RepID=A0ABD1SLF9_9LAMI
MLMHLVQSWRSGIEVCATPQKNGVVSTVSREGVTQLCLTLLESSVSFSSSMALFGTAFSPSLLETSFSLSDRLSFFDESRDSSGMREDKTHTATSSTNGTVATKTGVVHGTRSCGRRVSFLPTTTAPLNLNTGKVKTSHE